MATAGMMMEADGSTDVEKHIHNLEFENQQFVKAIEKERTVVNALEAQITQYEAEITRLQQATTQLDEDTKLYHRQFLQNRDNIESLKTSVRLSQTHAETLKDQYQHVIRKGQLEKEEHETTLEHYKKIWADYEAQYSKFPQAQVLNQANQELQKAQENLSLAIGRKHQVQETLKNRLSENGQSFKPYNTMNELVVKLAEIKVASTRKEQEIRTRDKECKEIAQEIEKRLQDALRIKQEAERKQQEEAQRRHELELQRQREEEAQRKREEEARRLHEEAQRKQEEEAQRKREEEAQRKVEEEAQRKRKEEELKRARATAEQSQNAQNLANSWKTSFSAPRLQMPPIIAQRGIKLPALQVPRRPSASMPQLNIPTMSPRPGTSNRVPASQASPPTAPLPPKPQPAPSPLITMSTSHAPSTPSLSMPMSLSYPAPSPLIPSAPVRPPGSQFTAVPTRPPPPPAVDPSVPLVTPPTETSSTNYPMEEAATSALPSSRSLLVPDSATSTPSPLLMSEGDSPTVPVLGTGPQNTPEVQMATTNTSCSPPPVKTPKRSEEIVTTTSKTPDKSSSTTPKSTTPKTPKTPGSGFSIEKELARMRLMTAESPSSGFLYSRRQEHEENSPNKWEQSPSVSDKEEVGLPFMHTFQGPAASKGGGDELPPRGGNKVSPKSAVTTEPVMTTPASPQGAGDAGTGFSQGFNFNSPATSEPSRAGMGMFGSPKVQEESGFNFFKTPSAAADNHMNLFGDSPMSMGAVGGFETSAPSTNVFSMFGGDSTDDGDSGQGGFSFNFGGTETNTETTSSNAAFSLF